MRPEGLLPLPQCRMWQQRLPPWRRCGTRASTGRSIHPLRRADQLIPAPAWRYHKPVEWQRAMLCTPAGVSERPLLPRNLQGLVFSADRRRSGAFSPASLLCSTDLLAQWRFSSDPAEVHRSWTPSPTKTGLPCPRRFIPLALKTKTVRTSRFRYRCTRC